MQEPQTSSRHPQSQATGATVLPSLNPAFPVIDAGKDTLLTRPIGTADYTFSGLPLNTDTALLLVKYAFNNITGQDFLQNQTNFPVKNDTTTRIIPLRNYFAYDDGTAESSIITQNFGTQAAVKFHSIIADTLQGIQLHIPAFDNDVSTQLFLFKVYIGSLNSTPIYTQDPFYPSRPYYGDSLEAWVSYPFLNSGGNNLPPYIPANTDFYVVWQQSR